MPLSREATGGRGWSDSGVILHGEGENKSLVDRGGDDDLTAILGFAESLIKVRACLCVPCSPVTALPTRLPSSRLATTIPPPGTSLSFISLAARQLLCFFDLLHGISATALHPPQDRMILSLMSLATVRGVSKFTPVTWNRRPAATVGCRHATMYSERRSVLCAIRHRISASNSCAGTGVRRGVQLLDDNLHGVLLAGKPQAFPMSAARGTTRAGEADTSGAASKRGVDSRNPSRQEKREKRTREKRKVEQLATRQQQQ